MAGKKIAVGAQGGLEDALVRFDVARVVGGLIEIPPGHGGLQLIAGGGARPAQGIACQGGARREREDWVEIAERGGEIAHHRVARGDGGVEVLRFTRRAPDGEQSANHDSTIEEVGKCGGVDLEGHGGRRGVPGADQEAGGGDGAIQVAMVAGDGMQVDKCAGGVPGDLCGGGEIAAGIYQIVAGDAAIRLLNSGVQEPLSGTRELWRQAVSLTSKRRPPG